MNDNITTKLAVIKKKNRIKSSTKIFGLRLRLLGLATIILKSLKDNQGIKAK